jgi:hypothetical protein
MFLGHNWPRKVKGIDFDVGGLALECLGVKTAPGKLKASILTSAGLLWKGLGSKPAPGG